MNQGIDQAVASTARDALRELEKQGRATNATAHEVLERAGQVSVHRSAADVDVIVVIARPGFVTLAPVWDEPDRGEPGETP